MRTFLKVWLSIALMALGFGIVILILAAVFGEDFRKDIATYRFHESYDNVKSIDIDIKYGEVNIIEGDAFSIEADNLPEDGLDSYVNDGTWYIQEDEENLIEIFGIHISVFDIPNWDSEDSPKITVTIPRGFVAEQFLLNIGAGDVKAEAIHSDNGSFSVAAGKLAIKQLFVSENSSFNVGAGNMELEDVTLNNITMDCGVGKVLIEGTLKGDNDISCGVGKIKLDLQGNDNDYSYDISSGVGKVVIGGSSYHNINKKIDNLTDSNLKLDCGVGKITVDFN